MGIHGKNEHEIVIGSTTKQLQLARDPNGAAMYHVIEEIPSYQNPLLFEQKDWRGGHGQRDSDQGDMYYDGQSIDTTIEGKVFSGPLINEVKESDDTALDSAPVCFKWFPATSELLCATSGKIYRYNVSSNLKWTAATTTVANVTDLEVFGATIYAATGSSNDYYYSTGGDTWTLSTLSGTSAHAQAFLTAPNSAGTAEVLWKFIQPNEVYSATDPSNTGSWSSVAYIGDASSNITNFMLLNDNLLIGRVDNLYYYDSDGGVHELMPELQQARSTNNFKYIAQWQSGLYYSLVTRLGEIISSNFIDRMGPLTRIKDIGRVGTCVGLDADDDFLYVAMDEGTDTIIYKGREVQREGGLRWEWCPWVYLGTNQCSTIKVVQHTATDKRLWFGYGSSGTTTGYVTITDDPTADSNARFASSGLIRMSYFRGTNQYWDKLFQSVITETKGCASGKTVTPYYRKDTDASSTALTAAISTNGTVKTNLTSALSCNKILFELQFATDSSSVTPEVSLFQARGIEKPETVRIHECTYTFGDRPSDRAETIRTFLRGGRTSTSLIKFADLRYGDKTSDTSYTWVIMQPGYPEEVEIIHEKGRQPELGLRCRFQEVSFTVS